MLSCVANRASGMGDEHLSECYDELSTDEAKAMIDDLAAFGSPVLLFSGGEPCVRPDLIELMHYAKAAGMGAGGAGGWRRR